MTLMTLRILARHQMNPMDLISLTILIILMILMTLMVTTTTHCRPTAVAPDLTASSWGYPPPDLTSGQIGHRTRFTFTPPDLRFLLTNQT